MLYPTKENQELVELGQSKEDLIIKFFIKIVEPTLIRNNWNLNYIQPPGNASYDYQIQITDKLTRKIIADDILIDVESSSPDNPMDKRWQMSGNFLNNTLKGLSIPYRKNEPDRFDIYFKVDSTITKFYYLTSSIIKEHSIYDQYSNTYSNRGKNNKEFFCIIPKIAKYLINQKDKRIAVEDEDMLRTSFEYHVKNKS